jgi:hypothetical protein
MRRDRQTRRLNLAFLMLCVFSIFFVCSDQSLPELMWKLIKLILLYLVHYGMFGVWYLVFGQADRSQ